MKRLDRFLIWAMVVAVALITAPVRADVNAMMGVSITTSSTIMGTTPVSAVMGQTVTSGGGGGIALVANLSYSMNNSSATTSPNINTTGADLIVIFVGAYKDWVPTAMADSQANTWTAATAYAGGSQGVRFWYCFNPSTSANHNFTPTVPQLFYTFVGVLAFSGMNGGAFDTESGYNGDTPLRPGSITPAANGSLLVSGVFNYAVGASPTIDNGFTYYGVAKSGNIGMGGHAWLVQTSAAAINPTWTSTGTAGGDSGTNIIAFSPP